MHSWAWVEALTADVTGRSHTLRQSVEGGQLFLTNAPGSQLAAAVEAGAAVCGEGAEHSVTSLEGAHSRACSGKRDKLGGAHKPCYATALHLRPAGRLASSSHRLPICGQQQQSWSRQQQSCSTPDAARTGLHHVPHELVPHHGAHIQALLPAVVRVQVAATQAAQVDAHNDVARELQLRHRHALEGHCTFALKGHSVHVLVKEAVWGVGPLHACRAGRQRASGGVQQAGAAAGGRERWRRSVGLFLAPSTPAQMPNIHIPPHSVDSSRAPKFRHSAGGSREPGARMAGLGGRSGTARRGIFAFRLTGTFTSARSAPTWLAD